MKVVAYVMGGEPSKDTALAYADAILREADVLEIGVPFSDPVADGPVIERAAVRALERGTTMGDCLALAKALRARHAKPIYLMTYYNPALKRGLARFAQECQDAGVTGVILPDVPLEESEPARAALSARGIQLVQLAGPASPSERIALLAQRTQGFLYLVSSFGVTGARKDLAPETLELVARAKKACGDVPYYVGFGVSEATHVQALAAAGAPGVVVGSAIVGRIEQGETPEQVAAFVRGLRA